MSSNKIATTKHFKTLDDVKKNLKTTELKKNDRVASQNIAWVSFQNSLFLMQVKVSKLDGGGIPPSDGPYNKEPKDQAKNTKIPCEINENLKNESDESRDRRRSEAKANYLAFENIDKYMTSDEFKIKHFGSLAKAKKYQYVPNLKIPQTIVDSDEEEEEKPSKNKHKPVAIKARIPMVWGSEEEIDVKLFIEDKTKPKNSEERFEEVEVKTLDELRKYVRYMGDMKFIIHCCKFWCNKQASNGSKFKQYGLTWKIKRIIVNKECLVGSSKSDDIDNIPICVDTDSEDEDNTKDVISNYMKSKNHMNESSDEESSSEEESSEEVAPKKSKKNKI